MGAKSVGIAEQRARALVEAPPCGCQSHPVALAVEEGQTQLLFQVAHGREHAGMAPPQPVRCGLEAAFGHDRIEAAELLQRRVHCRLFLR